MSNYVYTASEDAWFTCGCGGVLKTKIALKQPATEVLWSSPVGIAIGISGQKYIRKSSVIAIDIDPKDAEIFILSSNARVPTSAERLAYRGYQSRIL